METSFCWITVSNSAEMNYTPTEGESLAIVWSLEHAQMFVWDVNLSLLPWIINHLLESSSETGI